MTQENKPQDINKISSDYKGLEKTRELINGSDFVDLYKKATLAEIEAVKKDNLEVVKSLVKAKQDIEKVTTEFTKQEAQLQKKPERTPP